MKVSLITEGGRGIGFGHLTRCLSIAEELKKKGGRVQFIVNDDDALNSVLFNTDYKTYTQGARTLDDILHHARGSDVVLIDSYRLAQDDYRKLREVAGLGVYLDDNLRLHYPRGIIVNGAVYARELEYSKVPDQVYLLGPEFAPLRREFLNVPKRRINEGVQKVLVTFGADDARGMTVKVRDVLLKELKDASVDVVVGKAFRDYETLGQEKTGRVVYHRDITAQTMFNLMVSADLAVSAGGQTLHELAATGTPTIGICVADNQERNLQGWQNRGFLKYAGWYNDPQLFKSLKGCLSQTESRDSREQMARLGHDLIDGRGSERIAQKIMEAHVS